MVTSRASRNNFGAVLIAVLCAVFLFGCATSYDKRGRYHQVRPGDSIWRIASSYRVDVQELAEYNNIMKPDDVQPGMKLYIPPRKKEPGFKRLPFGDVVASSGKTGKGGKKDEIRVFRGRFIWPVEGRVMSLFGMRNGVHHDGIDISANEGTPIHASAAGSVVFAGQMRGYGNLILLRHNDDFFTAYAHNKVNKVNKGQKIKQRQVIALLGHTGRATGPHCHFEIRNGQTARNPLFFLPERDGSGVEAAQKRQEEREASGKSETKTKLKTKQQPKKQKATVHKKLPKKK